MDVDGLMPGDKVRIKDTLTVTSVQTGYYGISAIETEEDIDVSNFDYEIVDQSRPELWPPEDGDVWRAGTFGDYLYFLGEEFRDSDDDELDLHELLDDNSCEIADMKLVFRPGVTDKKK